MYNHTMGLEQVRPSLLEDNARFVAEGCEKQVFQIVENGSPFALKIIKNVRPGNMNVDIATEAQREFEAHLRLRQTPLKDMIPEPVRLYSSKGQVSGLIVEWKDGVPLENSQSLLTVAQMDNLQDKFLTLLAMGIVPNADMYSEGNIMVGENGIWIAECKILTPIEGNEELDRYRVENGMGFLRRNFTQVV